ncbi:MAG TPA: hypothetical protein VF252_12840 [Gemmatimonadales bacterium]
MTLRPLLLLTGAVTVGVLSCGDEQISAPTEGTLLVAALTTGDDMDQNGYTFSVNNSGADPIGLLDTVFVTALEAGSYEVRLSGIAENCSPAAGTNPQTTDVTVGDTASVVFNVTCELLGPPGGGVPLRTRR